MSEPADRVVLSPSRVTRRVEALELKGLVARRPDPEDGRSVIASVTAAGNRFMREVARSHHEIVRARFLEVVGNRERAHLAALWRRMLDQPDAASHDDA